MHWRSKSDSLIIFQVARMDFLKSSIVISMVLCLSLSFISANPNEHHGHQIHLDPDDPDFSGMVDFSNAIPGPDGTWCIQKTKYVEHMVKDSIKECWHQNVTQCHDSYVTEFLPSQEQKCEETFWKSCKIDFKEKPYNYTMKQCHTPLEKDCRPMPKGYGGPEPKIVCQTWFESECNTTFVATTKSEIDRPNTWCKKVPKKICAPDNCKMVPGKEQCNEKMLVSTIQSPSEICDLQPQKHCRLITRLTPHLVTKQVCRKVPKEVCHMALTKPHSIKKPMTMKWCTKDIQRAQEAQRPSYRPTDPPTYQAKPRPSYLPPGPPPTIPDKVPSPIYRAERNPSSSNSYLPSPSLLKTSAAASRLTISPQDQEFRGNRIEERTYIKDSEPEVKRTPIQLTPESIEEAWKDAKIPETPSTTQWNNNRVSSKESNRNSNRRTSASFREASSGFPSFESQIRGSYEEDLIPAASQEIIGSNRRNSFEEKQGTPIKIRKINPSARKPASKKPQQIRRTKDRSSVEKKTPQRLIKTPFEQVTSEEASASSYQDQFKPASVLAARGKLRARPKLQSIQEVEASKPKVSRSSNPSTTTATKLDIDNKVRPAVWDSQYQNLESPTFRPRVSSTRGTVRSRSTARGKARQIVKSDSSKEAPTKSRSSLLSKLKNLMQVPKAHPVSISDELSGGSRYFGAAGIFGAASESQESTGLF